MKNLISISFIFLMILVIVIASSKKDASSKSKGKLSEKFGKIYDKYRDKLVVGKGKHKAITSNAEEVQIFQDTLAWVEKQIKIKQQELKKLSGNQEKEAELLTEIQGLENSKSRCIYDLETKYGEKYPPTMSSSSSEQQ